MSVYLDYNASAPIDMRVLDAMIDVYRNNIGNADSRTHDFGEGARVKVEQARREVANLLGIKKEEVIFTSGATESNNIAVLGLKDYGIKSGRRHIITTSIEHKAIIEAVKHLAVEGFEVEFIDPDVSGRVNSIELLSKVREDTLLVSVMHVNNETGVIQPVGEIGEALAEKDVLLHIDATQSCGKMVEEICSLKYNLMSISAHKMHGPQGIGALILKKDGYRLLPISPLMYGGAQEHGIRPGTLPTALIAGFGESCKIAAKEYGVNTKHCEEIKNKILSLLKNSKVNYVINGDQQYCVPNTLNVSFLGVSSDALMLATKQYCSVSNGSACTSSNFSFSHVLSSMKLSDSQIESAIRISWGPEIDVTDVTKDFANLIQIVQSFL